MAITPLPAPPSRSAPATFSEKADALLGALPLFVTEANAQAAALDLNDTTDASSSSVAIGSGAKTFTVTAAKSFQPGMWLIIADDAAPSTNQMSGTVTSYSGTTLVMDIVSILGSGTKAAWTISQSAPGGLVPGGPLGTPSSGNLINCTGFPGRNLLINSNFRINQREYVSAATLAAGAYGHDRWKAGAGGGNYSFTQLAGPTTITIVVDKTLIQVIEDKNVVGGTYTLSWEGTTHARVGVNSATPSGDYAESPIAITGQTAGTVMSVEFSAGTLEGAQLEQGSVATDFEYRDIGTELALCQRYYQRYGSGNYVPIAYGYATNTSNLTCMITLKQTMRAAPTMTYSSAAALKYSYEGTAATSTAITLYSPHTDMVGFDVTASGSLFTIGYPALIRLASASAYLAFSSEL